MQKRGEITSSKIVGILLIVAGFIVVVFFLVSILNLGGQTEDEVCRTSILTRATAPEATQRYLPLKCTTKKICLTTSNGICSQFIGEKNVETIKISSKPEKGAKQINEIFANQMFDTFSITGRGNLDISSGATKDISNIITDYLSVSEKKPICYIHSRVALAPDLQANSNILREVDPTEYMRTEQVPGSSLTYLQTFTDRQINAYPSDFENNLLTDNPTTTPEIAFMFTQVLVEDETPWNEALKKGMGTGITIGGTLLSPAGRVTGIIGAPITIVGSILAIGISGGLAYSQASENQAFAATYCGSLTGAKSRQGCSVVMPIDYSNVTKINELCFKIEGNP